MRHLRAVFRFTIFSITTFGLYFIWWLGSFVFPNKVYWRQVALERWARSLIRISCANVEVLGTSPKAPFILVTNHVSALDVAVIRYAVPTVFVAKGEIDEWPFAGKIVRNMGIIFIDRQNRRDILRAGGIILDRVNAGEAVTFFPEGTSAKGEEVLPFNSSFMEFATSTCTPVHYAALNYTTPAGEPKASTNLCWWEDISFAKHIYQVFMVSDFTATITFGDEPVVAADRKELAKTLHQEVEKRFIPII